MGIQGLLPFLKKSSRPAKLSEFKGKTAAVDVYCWLHKGAFSCAEKLVKGEPTDGYIVYVMKQVNLLLSYNIKPILVFDGCHLPAKGITETKRRENRIKNRRKAKELLREGKIKEARECFQRCVDITSSMAHDVIKACRARNIDTIVAPYEADSQLAFLNQMGIADVVITEDSDLILFGCDKIIFKLDHNGEGVLVEKEKLHLSMNVSRDKFDFIKFRNMCILSGCDYLPSLHGIGLVKACRFFIVTSNPDVFTALCKLPQNLKMPHLEVTLEYRQSFMKAINTLLHQLVFDPIAHILRPLISYPPNTDHEDMPYCGKFLGHERAYQIALGNVDVQTGETVDNYDPVTSERPAMKSSSWAQKGDLVSTHPSIWDPNFEILLKDWSDGEQQKVEESAMRGKKCIVDVPVLKRKRPVVQPDKDDISEEFLESVYSAKKLKSEEENVKCEEENVKPDEVEPLLLADLKQETNTSFESEERIEYKDRSPCSSSQANDVSTASTVTLSPCHPTTTETILPREEEDDEKVVKTSINPFAKKVVASNSENINPIKAGKFSSLKRFSTPLIVRSRYFRTDQSASLEKEIVNDKLNSASPNREQNSKILDLMNATHQKSPVKSPLKPKNDFVLDSAQSKTPKKVRQITSSFCWGKKTLSDQFAFTEKEKMNSFNINSKLEFVKSELSSSSIDLETPPPTQTKDGEKTPQQRKNIFGSDSNLEVKKIDSGSSSCILDQLTPVDDEQKVPSPSSTILTPKSQSNPKCRVSGLKRPSSVAGKQKQLNLKDMFAFKKDIKKITSVST